jgi:hypothetical protein
MKNIIVAFSLVLMFSLNFVPQVEACPKRFRLIKAIGRAAKNGVIKAGGGITSGFRSLKGKIGSELSDNDNDSDHYTSYNVLNK